MRISDWSSDVCSSDLGPQFSSRAESLLYRAAGLDVIGMTAMPEAALAREAELCYQMVAMVTDFDAWHGEHEADRTSVVLGKSGAGSVDLGGRRILKKKKRQK